MAAPKWAPAATTCAMHLVGGPLVRLPGCSLKRAAGTASAAARRSAIAARTFSMMAGGDELRPLRFQIAPDPRLFVGHVALLARTGRT